MEKRYAPSKRRLDKARKEGNIPKSQYLSQSTGMFLGLIICLLYLRYSWVENKLLVEYAWTAGFKAPFEVLRLVGSKYLFLTLKLLLIVAVTNIATEVIQVGFHIEPGLISFKPEKISPVSGVKRIFDNIKKSWLILARFLLVLAILCWFFWDLSRDVSAMFFMSHDAIKSYIYKLVLRFVFVLGSVLVIFAIVDYFVQRKKWFNTVGMSLQDLKQEHKDDEGDPYIKSARKQQHRELLQQDLVKRIRAAKVLIVERAQ